jgi:hypothetical protein
MRTGRTITRQGEQRKKEYTHAHWENHHKTRRTQEEGTHTCALGEASQDKENIGRRNTDVSTGRAIS